VNEPQPQVTVFSRHVCELGEGPSYEPDRDRLFWLDIVGRKLLEKAWPDGETIVHDLPEMASAIAVIDAERQLLFTETGLWIRYEVGGRLERHCEIEADNPVTRSNDARVHPSGRVLVGHDGKGDRGEGRCHLLAPGWGGAPALSGHHDSQFDMFFARR
jgi:sugar lactone lactonase